MKWNMLGLLMMVALLVTGCAPFGTSAGAGFERGKFAGLAAADVERAATENDQFVRQLMAERDAYRRAALDDDFDTRFQAMERAGYTPTAAELRYIAELYAGQREALNANLQRDRITHTRINTKLRLASGDIEALLTAADLERDAQAQINEAVVNEVVRSATQIGEAYVQADTARRAREAAERRAREAEQAEEPEPEPEPAPAPPPAAIISQPNPTEE